MNMKMLSVATLVLLSAFSDAALAYVGPGAGLSLLGALWGLLLAVGTALAFVIAWPLRRARRRARERQRVAATVEAASAEAVVPNAREQATQARDARRAP